MTSLSQKKFLLFYSVLGMANLGFLTSLATGRDDIIEKFLNNYTFLTLSKKIKYGKSLQYSF